MTECICGAEIGTDTDLPWVSFSVTAHNSPARDFAVSLCGDCAISIRGELMDHAIDLAGQDNSTWPEGDQ